MSLYARHVYYMPRFFVNDPPSDGIISIYGEDARHIGRSLRMRIGDELTVCCSMTDYHGDILTISDDMVTVGVTSSVPSNEPSIDLTLFMAVPKLDKLELIVQKATELGAKAIVPVLTEHCVSRPEREQFEKKRVRLSKIASEAAKQSGRGIIPEVFGIITLDECLDKMRELNLGLICYEKGGASLGSFEYSSGMSVGLLVGPEGGFSEKEAILCDDAGVKRVWLGNRILRCETAPITAISIIMHLSGNI